MAENFRTETTDQRFHVDSSMFTKHYEANILQNFTGTKGIFCDTFHKIWDNLISWCPALTPNEYNNRRESVRAEFALENTLPLKPARLCSGINITRSQSSTKRNGTIHWDFPVNTCRTIKSNSQYLSIKNMEKLFAH